MLEPICLHEQLRHGQLHGGRESSGHAGVLEALGGVQDAPAVVGLVLELQLARVDHAYHLLGQHLAVGESFNKGVRLLVVHAMVLSHNVEVMAHAPDRASEFAMLEFEVVAPEMEELFHHLLGELALKRITLNIRIMDKRHDAHFDTVPLRDSASVLRRIRASRPS